MDVEDELELDGVVDGVDWSPPMFGQLPDFIAAPDWFAATAVVEVDLAAVPDELEAACATAPPASAAVAARVTISFR